MPRYPVTPQCWQLLLPLNPLFISLSTSPSSSSALPDALLPKDHYDAVRTLGRRHISASPRTAAGCRRQCSCSRQRAGARARQSFSSVITEPSSRGQFLLQQQGKGVASAALVYHTQLHPRCRTPALIPRLFRNTTLIWPSNFQPRFATAFAFITF